MNQPASNLSTKSETPSNPDGQQSGRSGSLTEHYAKKPCQDLGGILRSYAREHPDVAVVWAFGFGLVIGWRLKP